MEVTDQGGAPWDCSKIIDVVKGVMKGIGGIPGRPLTYPPWFAIKCSVFLDFLHLVQLCVGVADGTAQGAPTENLESEVCHLQFLFTLRTGTLTTISFAYLGRYTDS